MRFKVILLWLLSTPLLQAAELQKVEVQYEDGHYRLYLHALLAAPVRRVEKIITDYDKLKQINPYLKQSKAEQADDNQQTLVHLVLESCVLFICYEVRHDQRFEPINNGVLNASIEGVNSDFKSGSFRWTIQPDGKMTHIIMETDIEPGFTIPLIGPYILERKLKEIALATIENIEKLAREEPEYLRSL